MVFDFNTITWSKAHGYSIFCRQMHLVTGNRKKLHQLSRESISNFVFTVGKSAMETYKMLKHVYGSEMLLKVQAFEWHHCFREARESAEDDECCSIAANLTEKNNRSNFTRLVKSQGICTFSSLIAVFQFSKY